MKVRRFGRSGEVALSGSLDRTTSRTAEAVPSRGEEAPFFLDMFCIVTEFLLALDGNLDPGAVSVTLAPEGNALCADGATLWVLAVDPGA